MTSIPFAGERVAWWAAFRHRDFNLFQAARLASVLGTQMQSVAIGWQIYAITGRPLDLGWVGLAQFLPSACLSLPAGQMADRFERRGILMTCHAATATLSVALWVIARGPTPHLAAIYTVLVGLGVARAFGGPASQSILPTLVSREHFANAIAWGSSLWQTATVLGPTLGGIVFAATGGAETVYAVAAGCSAGAFGLVAAMHPVPRDPRLAGSAFTSLFAGVRYVWNNEIVLGAMSLDLFAVLLGGATALLPIYSRDILHLGPLALGVLRSAPAAGAAVTGIALALRPIERRAGPKMLACVALFGLATVVFGLSRHFALSLACLVVAGSADMVSVVVRSSLVQLATPDAMRGRVSAVNMVFIGANNELGEFESGLTAQWLGAVSSVVVGGVGTILVVAIWASRFRALRRVDHLNDVAAEP
ncbi:MAG: MFS transporter [Myxococcota bacterium]|nr:MFS transporter [Myxococcota bacterium]